MNSYKLDSQDTNCPVYYTTINDVTCYGRLSGGHYIKTTIYCGKLKAGYHKCAIIISKTIDGTYKLDSLTYESDKKSAIPHEVQYIVFPL